MVYAKGGIAFANVEASFRDDSFDDVVGAALEDSSEEEWISGYVVGGGIEFAVTQNVTLRGEYTFTDFEDGLTTTGTDLLGREFEFEHELDGIHMGEVAVSYKF